VTTLHTYIPEVVYSSHAQERQDIRPRLAITLTDQIAAWFRRMAQSIFSCCSLKAAMIPSDNTRSHNFSKSRIFSHEIKVLKLST